MWFTDARLKSLAGSVTFEHQDGSEETTTWSAMCARAMRSAHQLSVECSPGDRVLIALPPGLPYIEALLTCFCAGVIAVPAYPPRQGAVSRAHDRLDAIIRDCQPRAILSTRTAFGAHGLPVFELSDLREASNADFTTSHSVAFLQYTSGSTSSPKGVIVTHENLRANFELIRRSFGLDDHDDAQNRKAVGDGLLLTSWLPPYHDMGLIGGILCPLYLDGSIHLMAPSTFLRRPMRWLHAMSKHKARVSGAPNFAFSLCAKRATDDDVDALDLSHWRVALCGAEPVRAPDLAAFRARFARAGFNERALSPCYGLAEATLMVTSVAADEAAPTRLEGSGAIERVSCGRVEQHPEIDVRIVDPLSETPVPSGQEGEIWVAGASVCRGYWSGVLAQGRLCNRDYLRTGDLGLVDQGHLYVTGRIKDLIVVHGRNLHAEDVEASAVGVCTTAQLGLCAAFPVDGPDGEELALGVEIVRHGPELATSELALRIQRKVASELGCSPTAIYFVSRGSIPTTSSGKVRRSETRRLLLGGELNIRSQHHNRNTDAVTTSLVAESVATAVHVVEAALQGPLGERELGLALSELGLDSIKLVELTERLEACGVAPRKPSDWFTLPISELLAQRGDLVPAAPRASGALTPIQEAYLLGRRAGMGQYGDFGSHVYLELDEVPYDVELLNRTWNALLDRHPFLRSTFTAQGTWSRPLRMAPYVIREHFDVSDSALAALRESLAHRTYDPCHGPLFAVRLVHGQDGRQRLLLSIDMLVCDLTSLHRLLSEWRLLLDGRSLPPPSLSFEAFLESRRQVVPAASTASDDYPLGPLLPLRKGYDRSCTRFVRRELTVRSGDVSGLGAAAARANVSVSTLLLWSFGRVLRAWSSGEDFSIAHTVSARPFSDSFRGTVGDFTDVALIPLRAADSAERELLALQQSCLEGATSGRHMAGLDRVRAQLSKHAVLPERVTGVVFTSGLGIEETGATEAPGRLGFVLSQTPQVYLDHQVINTPDGLRLSWDAIDAIFQPGVLDAMFAAYRKLVEAWIAGAHLEAIKAIDLLPPSQRLARRAWLKHADLVRHDRSLLDPFRRYARETPDRPALTDGVVTLSYREVERQAGRIAAALARAGVRPGDCVPVRLARSTDQIAAVLGVLRAGAVYVPVDVSWPERRFEEIVRKVAAKVALCSEAGELTQSVLLDVQDALRSPDELPWASIDADATAYVIFTSGSTGVPKGVEIAHRAALNTVLDIAARRQIAADDRVLCLSSLSFDLSVFDIFGTFACGAAAVVLDEERARDPAAWAESARKCGVTIWNSVPALAEMMVEYLERRPDLLVPPLRTCMLSGDWIAVALPDRLRALFPGLEVISLGGATEGSIWSIEYPVGRVDPSWESIPYGRPLTNQEMLVLDAELRPRPDWVEGELYIGGDGVAKGYLHDEVLSAAAFLRHPVTGERLYRTGDLARFLPDGQLQFRGRRDAQVKVDGYRIELGEVEARLAQHSDVDAVVATIERSPTGATWLCAFVRTSDGKALDARTLAGFAAQTLPPYMVPRAIYPLREVPLTANGKLNREALKPPTASADHNPRKSNALESRILGLAMGVFELADFPVDRNFFDLGLTSRQLVKLQASLSSELRLEVPIVWLFQHATIEKLAARLTAELRAVPAPDKGPRRKRRPPKRPRPVTEETSS